MNITDGEANQGDNRKELHYVNWGDTIAKQMLENSGLSCLKVR